jgi:tRNA(Ile)-lysidine synthase
MFQAFIRSKNLLRDGQGVLVAYSGGPDSTCLLHLFSKLRLQVVAAHLNHQQRQAALEEQRMCQAFCESIGVPFLAGSADVPGLAKALGIGIEEAGRKARYEFLRNLATQLGDVVIATGHTLDDRVETIFLNMARGSGIRGMGGISAKRDGIIRPLLWARRQETLEYCVREGLPYISDPFNEDENFARVRVRKRLSPVFESLNSKAFEHVAKLADLAEEEDALLDALAVHAIVDAELKESSPLGFLTRHLEIRLDVVTLREANTKTLIRRSLKLLERPLRATFGLDQIEIVLSAIRAKKRAAVTAEGERVRIVVNEQEVHAYRDELIEPYCLPLAIPGSVLNESLGWRLCSTLTENAKGDLVALLDRTAVRGGLVVRPYQKGDRLSTFEHGLEKEKKLKDLFDRSRVRKMIRQRVPIVADDAGPVWVPCIAMASRVAWNGKGEPVALELIPL